MSIHLEEDALVAQLTYEDRRKDRIDILRQVELFCLMTIF